MGEVLPRISGTFHRADGVKIRFQITPNLGWSQWGGSHEELGQTVDILDAFEAAAREAGFFEQPEAEEGGSDG
jgi:hypothetical protein